MFFRYDPPASYYEPNEEPELECRVSDSEYVFEIVYNNGDTWSDYVSDWDAKECYHDIKSDAMVESSMKELKIYEIYEYYYVDRYGDEEVEYTEIGDEIYAEKL